ANGDQVAGNSARRGYDRQFWGCRMSERRANCCRYPEGGGRRFVRGQAKRPRSGRGVAVAAVELNGGSRQRAVRLASSMRNIRSPTWLEKPRSVAPKVLRTAPNACALKLSGPTM